jgi:predicted RNA binding protein YcfA (HicA-like mRNA interferase family)
MGDQRLGAAELTVKVRDVVTLLEADGWRHERQRGSHRIFRHPVKAGSVTVAGKANADIPRGTLASVRRQAGLKQRPRLPDFGPRQRQRGSEKQRERDD